MPEKKLDGMGGEDETDLDMEEIPKEVEDWARDNIGETPESKLQLVEELRELVYQRGDVTPLRMDDDFILRFLRARNYKLEPAYRLLVNYGTFRDENPRLHRGVNPLNLYIIGEADIISPMPYRDQNGRRMIIYKIGKWDPNDIKVDDILKASLLALEVGALEPRSQILGGVVIFDLMGLSLQHAFNTTPNVVSKVIQIMMTSFPMKMSSIHFVNESKVFQKIFRMFKPLLGDRYSQTLFFHGSNMSSLHKHIDPQYLPKPYGGVRSNYCYHEWFAKLRKNYKVVLALQELGYDVEDAKRDLEIQNTEISAL